MSSVLHAALVMLAPVAAAALVGLCWAHRASRMGWERSPESENKPLVLKTVSSALHDTGGGEGTIFMKIKPNSYAARSAGL